MIESTTTREILIVDYGMGNVGSLVNMIKKVGGTSRISAVAEDLLCAQKILLPGVGHFEMGMRQLRASKLDVALNSAREDGAKILGVCLGMQLMTRCSEESEESGLGWFDMLTRRFPKETSEGKRMHVPHMGWNIATRTSSGHVENVYMSNGRFYFVHSYYVDGANHDDCLATTQYGDIEFASSIGNANVQGVQFHPEKSHKFGMALFDSFVND